MYGYNYYYNYFTVYFTIIYIDLFFLISELFDHNDEINHINYNERLNMICTSSKDGFVNVYSFPNKLITTIKNNRKILKIWI